MANNKKRGQVYGIIFLVGILLLLSPLSRLADTPALLWGLPASYIYVFVAWMVIIVLLYIASRDSKNTAA